ncbi:hypothetical protein RDI58_014931 [Solanum bulbocastanum]|uniref:Uncharacterized protein n=1 Tax=Solanum bulbocastanum TaxID=147425 RepID=A0AAN8TJ70_SOLBU
MLQYLNFPDFQHTSSFRYFQPFGLCAGLFFRLSFLVRLLHEFYSEENVDLHKLIHQIEWLPLLLLKLVNVTELNIADNQIMALLTTTGSLNALTKLNTHSNKIINLPDSFGKLINLTDLDLHANRLKSLPASFRNLTNLIDLDSGLRLDYNQLKALPEAMGMLKHLEILTPHINIIKGLPTTMDNISQLRNLIQIRTFLDSFWLLSKLETFPADETPLELDNFIHYMATFLSGFVVEFTPVWQLALVAIVVVPLIAVIGAIYTMTSGASRILEKFTPKLLHPGKDISKNDQQDAVYKCSNGYKPLCFC